MPPLSALASPSDQVAADRKALDAAVSEFNLAQAKINKIQTEINNNNARLDTTLERELETQKTLLGRLEGMYRSGDTGFLDALFNSSSFTDLLNRWELLSRVTDADNKLLTDLEKSRRQIESSAVDLMNKQVEILEETERLEANMKAAQEKFSRSKTLLNAYNKRIEESKKAATSPSRAAAVANSSSGSGTGTSTSAGDSKKPATSKTPLGDGQWKSSRASHYSWTFGSGGNAKGASGKAINPSSMMVAHKTLPFGTKVEFEFNGRYAIASVEDRGPYTDGREWDLGPGTARALNFTGVHNVKWRILK